MRSLTVLALLAVVLAIAFVSANDSADLAWSRTDNPFMRMAKKLNTDSLIEVGAPDDKGAANASDDDDDGDDSDAQENDKTAKKTDTKTDTKAATPATPAAAVEKAKTQVTALGAAAAPAANKIVPQVKEADSINEMLGKSAGGNQDSQTGQAKDAAGKILAKSQAGNPPVACGNVALCGKNATASAAAAPKQNFTTLVPVQPKVNELDMGKLGATPKMSVSNKDFKVAKKVVDVSGTRHEEFLNKHEKDCAGPICGGNSK